MREEKSFEMLCLPVPTNSSRAFPCIHLIRTEESADPVHEILSKPVPRVGWLMPLPHACKLDANCFPMPFQGCIHWAKSVKQLDVQTSKGNRRLAWYPSANRVCRCGGWTIPPKLGRPIEPCAAPKTSGRFRTRMGKPCRCFSK